MKRILVIGGNGSGKTTFSKKLAEKLDIPLVHLDKLNWCGNWEVVPKDRFDRLLQNELDKESWILDGNYNRTIPHRIKFCDTVFYFDFSTVKCLYGVTKRVIQNFGKTRPDMGGNCPEKFDMAFYKNILTFNKKHRKAYYKLLSDADGINVIVFKNRQQSEIYLNNL